MSVDVNWHHGCGALGDQGLQRVDVDVEGLGVHVDEHGPQPGEYGRGGGGVERERRNQNLAVPRQVERQQRQEQAERSVRGQDGVARSGIGLNGGQEFGRVRALGQPPPANTVRDPVDFVVIKEWLDLLDSPRHERPPISDDEISDGKTASRQY